MQYSLIRKRKWSLATWDSSVSNAFETSITGDRVSWKFSNFALLMRYLTSLRIHIQTEHRWYSIIIKCKKANTDKTSEINNVSLIRKAQGWLWISVNLYSSDLCWSRCCASRNKYQSTTRPWNHRHWRSGFLDVERLARRATENHACWNQHEITIRATTRAGRRRSSRNGCDQIFRWVKGLHTCCRNILQRIVCG